MKTTIEFAKEILAHKKRGNELSAIQELSWQEIEEIKKKQEMKLLIGKTL
jgi:hypothetical protein